VKLFLKEQSLFDEKQFYYNVLKNFWVNYKHNTINYKNM